MLNKKWRRRFGAHKVKPNKIFKHNVNMYRLYVAGGAHPQNLFMTNRLFYDCLKVLFI